jgi:hypothetical protein
MASTTRDDIERLDAQVHEVRSALGDTLGALAARADVSSRAKAKAAEVKQSATAAIGKNRPVATTAAVGAAIGLAVAAAIALVMSRRRP